MAAWLRFLERWMLIAIGDNSINDWDVWDRNFEHASNSNDAGQTNVGHGHMIPMAKLPGLRFIGKPVLYGRKADPKPLHQPGLPGGIIKANDGGQILLNAWRN